MVKDRRIALLAHIIRISEYDEQDPILRATLGESNLFRHMPEKRRVGKPRTNWTCEAYKDAYYKTNKVKIGNEDIDEEVVMSVAMAAHLRDI